MTLPVSERDHIRGPKHAPLTLVEYGDYECPSCGEAYPIVKRLQKKLGNDLSFVFRNFPLTEIHPHALAAARAAEAAALQGKFWEMHDLLFEHQDALTNDDLLDYGDNLELEMERFERDFGSDEISNRLQEEFRSGIRSGVNGTPTFFINGVRHDGSYAYNALLAALEHAMPAQPRTRATTHKRAPSSRRDAPRDASWRAR